MKELKWEPIKSIRPYEKNPRRNDEAVDAVAASIREFGWQQPIVVDRDGVIIAGHTRYKAAKKLKCDTVPVVVADDLTEDQVKAYRLADNKTGELAEWDTALLDEELAELAAFDMEQFGFDVILQEEASEAEEDDYEVNPPEETKAKLGDIYQLGRHRLMCGDSTSATDIEKLMSGNVADTVFTDPPYGMKKEKDGVANDNLNYDDLLEFNRQWIPLTFAVLKDMGSWYCWGIDEPLMDIYAHILKPLSRDNKIVIRNYITWAKHSAFGMNSDLMLSYPRETEKCWFVVKGQNWNNNNAEFFNYKYQPVLDYLNGEAKKVGLNGKRLNQLTGVQMWSHWFTHSQFTVIPQKHYETLQKEYNVLSAFLLSYEEVRGLIGGKDEKKAPEKPYFDLTWFDDGGIPLTDVWRVSTTSEKEREQTGGHATPKPIKLCERAVVTSTRKNENVLDVFGGSGSTLIACEQLERNCFMMELEPKWVDVIIHRWEKLTGKKAVLLDGTDCAGARKDSPCEGDHQDNQ